MIYDCEHILQQILYKLGSNEQLRNQITEALKSDNTDRGASLYYGSQPSKRDIFDELLAIGKVLTSILTSISGIIASLA